MFITLVLGIISTILLVFFGESVFSLFINENEAISQGAVYLKIVGYSQLFMCIEITTAGAFRGFGKTYTPSFISILLTGARVPIAYILSKPELLGIDGVWWSISISSVVKGILMLGVFLWMLKVGNLYKKSV